MTDHTVLKRPILLGSLALTILPFLLPIYAKLLGASTVGIGGLFAIAQFVIVLCRPIIGWALDRFGRKVFFVTGVACYAGAMGLFALASNVTMLYLAQFVQGLATALTWTSAYTIATALAPSTQQGRTVGRVDEYSAWGALYGLLVTLAFLSWLTLSTAWSLLFLSCAILAVWGTWLAGKQTPETRPSHPVAAGRKPLVAWPLVRVMGVVFPVDEWVQAFHKWIRQLGVWGRVLFAGVYILGTVLLVPGAPLSLVAGLAFGLGWGVPLVLVSATIGAALAFLVARYLVRDKVAEMAKRYPKLQAVDKAVSEEGWKEVALLRLSPLIPFNIQNYLYGVTEIKLWHYVSATLVGIFPGTLMYVYLGAAGKAVLGDGGNAGGGGGLKWGLFATGLVATIIVAVSACPSSVTAQASLRMDPSPSSVRPAYWHTIRILPI